MRAYRRIRCQEIEITKKRIHITTVSRNLALNSKENLQRGHPMHVHADISHSTTSVLIIYIVYLLHPL